MTPKKDKDLPPAVYRKHGAYYLVRQNKWIRLGTHLPESLQAYGKLKSQPRSGISGIVDRAIEDAQERGLADGTMKQYRMCQDRIKEAFAEFSVEEVQPKHVGQFMDHHRKTPNLANRMRSVLKMAFDHAVTVGLRDTNPVVGKRLKEKKRDRYITDDEWDAVYAAAPPALQCVMAICYLTAQRIGDVLAIRLSDITDEGILFRQEKTGARLLLRPSPDLDAVIATAKALHGKTTAIYLLGQRNGKIRSYGGVRDLMRRAIARAKVEDFTLHDIRAKSLTDAKKQGINPQALAGHTTEAQTLRYIRDRETAIVTGPTLRQSKI